MTSFHNKFRNSSARALAFTGMTLLLLGVSVSAAPVYINYQGRLTTGSGIAVPDTIHQISFQLFADSTGGLSLWSETADLLPQNGLFSHLLGSLSLLTSAVIADSHDLFLEVSMLGEVISPRSRMSSVPISAVANDLRTTNADDSVVILTSGELHRLILKGTDGGERVIIDGLDFGQITLSDSSGAPAIVFNAGISGNSSVILPDSSISAAEIFDEPGLVLEKNSEPTVLSTVGMADLNLLEITIPVDGFIVLHGKCYLRLSGTTGPNMAMVQIDEHEAGQALFPYYAKAGLSGYVNTLENFFPIYVTRTYFKEAGTYEFRMEGMAVNSSPALAESWDHMLTAVFYTSAYGYVGASSKSEESSNSDELRHIEVSSDSTNSDVP